MLKNAELGRSLSKEQYDAVLPGLRAALLDAQARLRNAKFSVVVLVNGPDTSGKSETVNALHEWFDARFLTSQAYSEPTEEERAHPEYWRYWLWLPPAGRIGVFSGSWYTEPIAARAFDRITDMELAERTARINGFERTLADGGTLFVKLWFHIGKKSQRKRLKELASKKTTRFRVTKQDWKNHERYDELKQVSEQVISHTSTGYAP
jgi:AMP-polyphosphate phosphotransferase